MKELINFRKYAEQQLPALAGDDNQFVEEKGRTDTAHGTKVERDAGPKQNRNSTLPIRKVRRFRDSAPQRMYRKLIGTSTSSYDICDRLEHSVL